MQLFPNRSLGGAQCAGLPSVRQRCPPTDPPVACYHSILREVTSVEVKQAVDLLLFQVQFAQALFNLEREKPYVSAVPSLWRHRSVIYRATINLTRMREITQDLAGLFGLTLPAPEKAAARR